jgi:nucleotide-binding universal stress UspA family protein
MPNSNTAHVIVAGIDYSDLSDLALDQALAIAASQPCGEVHALSVATLLVTRSDAEEVAFLREERTKLAAHLERRIALFQERRGAGAPVPARVVGHVRFDAPAREIAQLAADLGADLVIVGTHGRRGLSRMLIGSVAEGVVRLATCPVLVVRPKVIESTPSIQPPCPECVKVRQLTSGARFWCDQHSERHGQRHTYYGTDRVSQDGSMPLVSFR